MLITIGLFLAVVLLLLIGYIGEMIASAGETSSESEYEITIECDPTLQTAS